MAFSNLDSEANANVRDEPVEDVRPIVIWHTVKTFGAPDAPSREERLGADGLFTSPEDADRALDQNGGTLLRTRGACFMFYCASAIEFVSGDNTLIVFDDLLPFSRSSGSLFRGARELQTFRDWAPPKHWEQADTYLSFGDVIESFGTKSTCWDESGWQDSRNRGLRFAIGDSAEIDGPRELSQPSMTLEDLTTYDTRAGKSEDDRYQNIGYFSRREIDAHDEIFISKMLVEFLNA